MVAAPALITVPDLGVHGINSGGLVRRNVGVPVLVTDTVRAGAGVLAEGGALVVDTGEKTGRSADDKYVVREPGSEERIWWGKVNKPLEPGSFERLRAKVVSHLDGRDLYVVDAYAGADPAHRLSLRVVTPSAYHALFAQIMFIPTEPDELEGFTPDAVVLHAPEVEADPATDGTRTGTFIALHPTRLEVLIGGTAYAGEIKKSIFTLMNDRLPLEGVFPMHCSANAGDGGDVAIFFGLSGTGKTTLSADPARHLIGDDEHGWGPSGVFNFEDGCYAKVIRLSAEAEPEIYATTRQFGTLLENVVIDDAGGLDLWSEEKTENTRGAYKLAAISNSLPARRGGHPDHVVFLTADAFGVMPPIARLTEPQAAYHFLSGFTAKLAGTEIGVTEPSPTFSPCFGGPFLPQPPAVYARLLHEKLLALKPSVWLVNTGWTGGAAGHGGHRMPIAETRALLHAALAGALTGVETRTDRVFGFQVPVQVPGVNPELLDPRSTWEDPAAYDAKAQELASLFRENFERFADVDPEVAAAGPVL
jgi:phosphoenolpyruvate carboxykinase (ATP)